MTGGFDLGFERAGIKTIWQVEVSEFCRKVLARQFPKSDIHGEITEWLSGQSSSAGDSHARTSPMRETVPDWAGSVLAFGGLCYQPFAWYDQGSQSWRTWQRCLSGEWAEFSGTWPESGMTRDGLAYQLAPLVRHTCDEECSLWPTPTASMDGRGFGIPMHNLSDRYKSSTVLRVQELVRENGWRIHPNFTEALMGLPMDWTAIEQSEMQYIQP
jgi:hypothetical protein